MMKKYSTPEAKVVELKINVMLMVSPDNSMLLFMNPEQGAIEDWHEGNIVIGV